MRVTCASHAGGASAIWRRAPRTTCLVDMDM